MGIVLDAQGAQRQVQLGRLCELRIDGRIFGFVKDVNIRQVTNEIDATGYGRDATSSLVVHRSYEIELSVPELLDARRLRSMTVDAEGLPNVVKVELVGGLWDSFVNPPNGQWPAGLQQPGNFTIHEVQGDEPLDDIVTSKFVLKQWDNDLAGGAA